MNVLVLLLISGAIFIVAARLYGRLVARWVGEDVNRPTPATTMTDGCDYVPTNPNVVFAHHFSAIAGAGPIVGPTMAILYGVLPVWLWVVVGGVLIGAVHDFTTLFISLRERGRSMAEIARTTLGDRGFLLFICFATVMIILVTSAMHMPRSKALFKNQGLNVIPAPVDFTITEHNWHTTFNPNLGEFFIQLLPSAGSLNLTTNVIREYIGLLIYSLRGWL